VCMRSERPQHAAQPTQANLKISGTACFLCFFFFSFTLGFIALMTFKNKERLRQRLGTQPTASMMQARLCR